jgi:hypothetical protein
MGLYGIWLDRFADCSGRQRQILVGKGRQESKCNDESNSRFPSGITDKKGNDNDKCNSGFPSGMTNKKKQILSGDDNPKKTIG